MFDLLDVAERAPDAVAGVAGWVRVENAACARRLAAMAAVLQARLSEVDAAAREQWCVDNWAEVAGQLGAALGVSSGVASGQLLVAHALVRHFPQIRELFGAGLVSYRVVAAIVARTRLVTDAPVWARLDAELAAQIGGWGGLSRAKLEQAIDGWVDRLDPYAVRRSALRARGRAVTVEPGTDGSGVRSIWGELLAVDAAVLDERLEAMAAAVCAGDGRTRDQRRADALGALAAGAAGLVCGCGTADCPAAAIAAGSGASGAAVVIHVIAQADSLESAQVGCLQGQSPPDEARLMGARLAGMTAAQALRRAGPAGPAGSSPGVVVGAGVLPGAMVAVAAGRAVIRRIIHPGAAGPEAGYVPSRALADFVRCRDVTCRFPGCDVPAFGCDVDHTIAYPRGLTQASNLTCLCRKHHLLKTFWDGPGGWRDRQLPDGTVIWTAPGGHTYTTYPGSRVLFPALCTPTAPVRLAPDTTGGGSGKTLMMPRRTRTRTQDRAHRIATERNQNLNRIAEPSEPPPE
ncbi:MAG: DUF222 domain-containing protein [Actinobacteria bacterium]|nr:DUF222 domain-containing protein [Actinomycetota bacterium]